ncbi:MAG TPA: DNA polymerase III subunit beta [Caulifigura sp.]|nr:DNA polymerase III subunit beta [Caulifigura sp.]
MKLHCSRSVLASAFQTVGGVVPTRTPKDILRNVKLVVGDGQGTLVGTDQEVGIRYLIPGVQTDSAGEVLLPTQRVSAILREVQSDDVEIEVGTDALWIRSGRSEFKLSIIDPAEFPDVAEFNDSNFIAVPGKLLKTAIQRTVFAADVESTRYALGGVLMDVKGNDLTLAATDSRRLAVSKAPVTIHGELPADAPAPIIPSKAMSLIERNISDPDADVQIAAHKNDVLVKCGSTTIYSRLVEGRFPKYQDVVPKSSAVRIELVAGPFLSAVRQAMIVTNEESRGVDFSFGGDTLTLASVGADVGTSRIELPVSYGGDEITVTFDPKFVVDFLRVFDSATAVSLNLNDANSAALFTAEQNHQYVVMPLARE